MLICYRRHNRKKCKLTSRSDYRCKCPVWVTGTKPDGQFVRESLKLHDWLRAQEIVRKWDVEGEKPVRPERVTLEDFKTNFLAVQLKNNLAGETIRKYKLVFKQLEAFAKNEGIRYFDQFDLPMLDKFRAGWTDAPLSASKKIERLRTIFKFALKRNWLTNNPAEELQMPIVKFAPTLPFSDQEMQKILKAADARIEPFILTMRWSGLRISDTTTLSINSLHDNRLQLYQAKTGEPVSVLLPGFVADKLKAIDRKNEYFYWTGRSTIPAAVSLWRKRLAVVFKAAKIKQAHSHRFRDTFAVGLLTAGVSLESVSKLLGHQNVRITERHYSPWIKTRQDALDREVEKVIHGVVQPVAQPDAHAESHQNA